MIIIVDYGMGNLGSIYNMLKRIGYQSSISSDIDEIQKASKLILPGVGAFDRAMHCIRQKKIMDVLKLKALEEKVPVLGICLGMQLLTKQSEEGESPGLGWISAETVRFNFQDDNKLKIPHMGWNNVNLNYPSELTKNLPDPPRFYFVHSYYVKVENQENSILTTKYGIHFDSAIQKDNIFGVQFHAEKSHKYGMKILENFAKL